MTSVKTCPISVTVGVTFVHIRDSNRQTAPPPLFRGDGVYTWAEGFSAVVEVFEGWLGFGGCVCVAWLVGWFNTVVYEAMPGPALGSRKPEAATLGTALRTNISYFFGKQFGANAAVLCASLRAVRVTLVTFLVPVLL